MRADDDPDPDPQQRVSRYVTFFPSLETLAHCTVNYILHYTTPQYPRPREREHLRSTEHNLRSTPQTCHHQNERTDD